MFLLTRWPFSPAPAREIEGVDLLSGFTPIRWIITKAALMEGWDCPFAYLLVMLDNTQAKRAITQLVGRVMRQPHAKLTGRKPLDQCYVYCQSTDVGNAVQYVKDGLEQEGMGDLDDDVRTDQATNIQDPRHRTKGEVQGHADLSAQGVTPGRRGRLGRAGLPKAHTARHRRGRYRSSRPSERASGQPAGVEGGGRSGGRRRLRNLLRPTGPATSTKA